MEKECGKMRKREKEKWLKMRKGVKWKRGRREVEEMRENYAKRRKQEKKTE